ncbi:MAG: 5-formyltetrahydrofolate cyclo-ligase [Terricaulis sp.]
MSEDLQLEALKAEARRAMRAERAACADPQAALLLMETFPIELTRLSPVAGYWPVGGEIDPRPLLAGLSKVGREIALPRTESRSDAPRFFAWRAGDALSADAFGVPSPPAKSRALRPRLILTPLLAFDRTGGRLGQGGGHYDRILALYRAEGAVAVGLGYAAQEMDRVPTGPLDAPLDWIVTEREAIRCAPAGAALRGLSGT